MLNQSQKEQLETKDLINFDRDCFFEGEPTIKNAHTATYLQVYQNSLVFVCIEESIYIYSLTKIAQDRATLVNVIALNELFNDFQKEHYEDLISKMFRNAQKQDFSNQIFSRDQDVKSNILLRVQNIKNRIQFFNNSKLRVKNLEFSQSGNVFVLLQEGRAGVISHQTKEWNNKKYKCINLNEMTKQKINQGCFINKQIVCLVVEQKLQGFDFREGSKIFSHKLNINNINKMKGFNMVKDRIKLIIVSSEIVHVIELNKKKILSNAIINIGDFINKICFYPSYFFVATSNKIIKINNQNLEETVIHKMTEPCELLHIDQFGNYSKKSKNNNKESLWLLNSTTNGIFVGLTIRKQGNYKQGRLIIFEPRLTYYIQKLISNVKQNCYIDTKDCIFIPKTKENKELLSQFTNLYKKQKIQFQGIEMTSDQFNTVNINIGHAFEGKQIVKQRIIEKTLSNRFQDLILPKKKLSYFELTQRCCFTGMMIFDQQLNYCKKCEIFGIRQKGDKCVVCKRQMKLYE